MEIVDLLGAKQGGAMSVFTDASRVTAIGALPPPASPDTLSGDLCTNLRSDQ